MMGLDMELDRNVMDGTILERKFKESEQDELYDPEADEKDAEWVSKHLIGERSDAILQCPMCFNTVCYDCQKHVEYSQYRAMFVVRCKILHEQILRVKGTNEVFHPVQCGECGAEIGVYDSDEVYHFFQVVAQPCSKTKEEFSENLLEEEDDS
ncbi:E2F-associated phosphoprotein-domain-containing protein [Globomyces pollinis-pini]|nr:E2F-associated phosphoprotein-domain-containing protein [Globomyces pollinis-pini]